MSDDRPVSRRWAYGLTAIGVLVMGWAGVQSARLRPPWLDHDDGPPCARSPGGCPADIDAALTAWWWWVGVGGALALVGLVLLVRGLGNAPSQYPPSGPLLHAGAVGVIGGVIGYGCALFALFALLFSAHALPLGIGAGFLGQAVVVAALDHGLGRTPPRRALLTGMAACALGVGATLLFLTQDRSSVAWPAAPVVDGAVLALCVAVARAFRRRSVAGRGAEGRAVAVFALLLVAVVGGAVGLSATRDEAPRALARTPVPAPAPSPAPDPAPAPVPPPAPPLPPVEAPVPCAMADLAFSVVGFDAAMGARAAALQATNVSTSSCWVEGVPVVTLSQGRPLRLVAEPGQAPSGGPAPVQRVGLAPGGTALSLLTWRTYGGLADDETPQSVTAAVGPGLPQAAVTVMASGGPAPFDLIEGAAWGIAPWAPPWN